MGSLGIAASVSSGRMGAVDFAIVWNQRTVNS